MGDALLHQTALAMRQAGAGYRQIAVALDVGTSTVYRWCNPTAAERSRATSRAWKAAHAEENREAQRDYRFRPDNRGQCANPVCTNLRGQLAQQKRPAESEPSRVGRRTYTLGYCAECAALVAAVRRSLAEGVWAAGWPSTDFREIAGNYPGVARSRGWDVPYRYKVKPRAATSPFYSQQAA